MSCQNCLETAKGQKKNAGVYVNFSHGRGPEAGRGLDSDSSNKGNDVYIGPSIRDTRSCRVKAKVDFRMLAIFNDDFEDGLSNYSTQLL